MSRTLHTKVLYEKIHKFHHKWTQPTALSVFYMHPVEFILAIVVNIYIGYWVTGCHTGWVVKHFSSLDRKNRTRSSHFPCVSASRKLQGTHESQVRKPLKKRSPSSHFSCLFACWKFQGIDEPQVNLQHQKNLY